MASGNLNVRRAPLCGRTVRANGTIFLSGQSYRVIQPGLTGCLASIIEVRPDHLLFECGDQTYVAALVAPAPGES